MSTVRHGAAELRRFAVAAPLLVAMSLLTACGTPPETPAPSVSGFTGPWAEQYASFDEATDSDFGHRALADSTLTDSEVQEGMALILECYASRGFTVEYDRFGFETVTSIGGTADPMEVMGICAFADGGVVALNDMMRVNPDNLDQFTILADCLVDAGIVEPGFTARDLENAYESDILPWSESNAEAMRCVRDPLGLVPDEPAADAAAAAT